MDNAHGITKEAVRKEALARQGTKIHCKSRIYQIQGNSSRAEFPVGSEGLVHTALEERTGKKYRIKCFWCPTEERKKRSIILAKQQLADLGKTCADALGGAPFDVLGSLGPSTPFAVVMKDVQGFSWKDLKERATSAKQYPPPNWPKLNVRATWAYGLAFAVHNMEKRDFIHADMSQGNVMVTPDGENAGDMALVDFDGFVTPRYNVLDHEIKGTPGFAAPEIFNRQFARVGSDRVGMAILIQEFLVIGSEEIPREEAFGWTYDQETELNNYSGVAHPFFKDKFPDLAHLVERSIQNVRPEDRPSPSDWLPLLYDLAMNRYRHNGKKIWNVSLRPQDSRAGFNVSIADQQTRFDLLQTPFRIRADFLRDQEGNASIAIHSGAEVRAKISDRGCWQVFRDSDHIPVDVGLILYDQYAAATARIDGIPG